MTDGQRVQNDRSGATRSVSEGAGATPGDRSDCSASGRPRILKGGSGLRLNTRTPASSISRRCASRSGLALVRGISCFSYLAVARTRPLVKACLR